MANSNVRLTTPEQFLRFVKSDSLAKRIIEVFGGDNTDFIGIIALVYPNTIDKALCKQLYGIHNFPELNEYVQQFKEHPLELSELIEIGTRILRFDRDDAIRSTLEYKAREYRDRAMGAEPTPKRLADIILRIEQETERLKNSDKENPMIGFLETFHTDSRELLEMWNRTRDQFRKRRQALSEHSRD